MNKELFRLLDEIVTHIVIEGKLTYSDYFTKFRDRVEKIKEELMK
jgi:hypothetical protein